MRVLLALFAVLCVGFVSATEEELIADVQRFIDLIPRAQVAVIRAQYFLTDPEFNATIEFTHGPRAEELILYLDTAPGFQEYFAFLDANEIPGYYWLNQVRAKMGWPPYNVPPQAQKKINSRHARDVRTTGSRTYTDYFNDVLDILPAEEYVLTWDDLMATSGSFPGMIALYHSPEYEAVRSNLENDPIYVEVDNEMIANGFDFGLLINNTKIWFQEAYGMYHVP